MSRGKRESSRSYFGAQTGVQPSDVVEFEWSNDDSIAQFVGEGARADLLRAYQERYERKHGARK